MGLMKLQKIYGTCALVSTPYIFIELIIKAQEKKIYGKIVPKVRKGSPTMCRALGDTLHLYKSHFDLTTSI